SEGLLPSPSPPQTLERRRELRDQRALGDPRKAPRPDDKADSMASGIDTAGDDFAVVGKVLHPGGEPLAKTVQEVVFRNPQHHQPVVGRGTVSRGRYLG